MIFRATGSVSRISRTLRNAPKPTNWLYSWMIVRLWFFDEWAKEQQRQRLEALQRAGE